MADRILTADYSDREGEVWASVVGFEGRYEVSNYGAVRSLDRQVQLWRHVRTYPGQMLKPRAARNGYLRVKISDNGSHKWMAVHRLVCEAFNGPQPDGKEIVAHNDGCRTNNRAENLRWASWSENTQDRFKHGTMNMGPDNPSYKFSDDVIAEIRNSSEPPRVLAAKFSISKGYVNQIRSGVARAET